MDYIIRNAKLSDLKTIQNLSQEFIEQEKEIVKGEYMTSLNWATSDAGYQNYKRNIEHDYLFVVCVEDEIIGYMTCWINKKQDWDIYKTLEIGNIYVKKEYRNNGIGSKLIEKAKNICSENDIKVMEIKVLYDNESAKRFYKKHNLKEYMITQYLKI